MVKTISTQNKDSISKHHLNTPKDGFIHKKKNQKFKQTPSGKVTLINGSKSLNNSNMKEQNLQKRKSTTPQKSEEKNKGLRQNDSPKGGDTEQQEYSKKTLNKKINLVQSDDTNSDSDEDINEGIVLPEESIVEETDEHENEGSDDDDDESEEEIKLAHVLQTSLADESDEDDEDYEEEEKEEKKEETKMKKGVKMFKGLSDTSSNTINNSSDSEIEEEEEAEDDDDDEEDEDNDEDEEHDEDDLISEEDADEDEDEDEDEEEEEEEEEEEADESALGLKALLSNSIADEDDEDDEDFVVPGENEDDVDISDEDEEEEEEEEHNTSQNSQKSRNSSDSEEESRRTIFVGNLPSDVTKKALMKQFKTFGKIDSIRIRGIISKTMNMPKKVAAITKNVHPKLRTVYAYIKYDTEASAKAALSMNGTVFQGNHLKVDMGSHTENKLDGKRSVFLGNLKFNIDEETIRNHFKQCGEIESIRIIRDNMTGIGKGFGYVNFKTEDAVTLALELHGTILADREIRVKPHVIKKDTDTSKYGKRTHSGENTDNSSRKKAKNSTEATVLGRNKQNKIAKKEQKMEKPVTSPQQGVFQGQKADATKKRRKNKSDKRKKILAEKLTAKPKKPSN
ncbi:RNA-binding protein 34 [Anthophora retusa]